jgi:hypothetical protein
VPDARAQLKILLGPFLCARQCPHAIYEIKMPVLDALAAIIGVVQICPCDDRCYDEQLCPKMQAGAIERVNGRDHSLACFDQQLIAAQVQTGLRINIRPGCEEI